MRKVWGLLVKEAVIVIICAVAGVMALAVSYLIPHDRMRDNVWESSIFLHKEGERAYIWEDIEKTALDNYTDGLMLNISYTATKNGIRDILLNPYVKVSDTNPMESLFEVIANANDDYIVRDYGRYWHGYQIILRPLLCFFNYSHIRQMNMILQLLLVFFLVYILARSEDRIFILPFLGMYLFLCPVSLFSSLQYSSCFYIMLLTLITLYAFEEKLIDTRRNYLFLFSGILTAFFDLLTYPLITVAVPLIAYLGFDYKRAVDDRMHVWKNLFFHTVSWGIGYVGMWSAKWVIATILTEENEIYNSLERLKLRSGYFSVKYSYWDTLRQNLDFCNIKSFLIMVVCVGIFVIAVRMKNHIGMERKLFPCVEMIFLVSLYPFAWYLFTKNHSYIHSFFTWRELAICVFGILMIAVVRIRQVMENSFE